MVIFTGIECELWNNLEAKVSPIPGEALLVARRVHLQVAVPIREALRANRALKVLNVQLNEVAILYIYLIVTIHAVQITNQLIIYLINLILHKF